MTAQSQKEERNINHSVADFKCDLLVNIFYV